MFVGLSDTKPISIKVANYVKIPYVKDKVDFYRSKITTYNGLYNLIYGIEREDTTTYFKTKNDAIYYHRKLSGEPKFFWFDTNLNDYKLIHFGNLRYSIKGLDNLLIRTSKDEWYIISDAVDFEDKKNCLALIDITRDQHRFIASKNDNVFLKHLYPIADAIFPILQVTKYNILVNLFDLSNNRTEVASWDVLVIIRHLILILLEKRLNSSLFADIRDDTINLFVKECHFCCSFYDLLYDSKKESSIGNVTVVLDLTLMGLKYKYVIDSLHIRITARDEGGHIYLSVSIDIRSAVLKFFASKKAKKVHTRLAYYDYLKYLQDLDLLSLKFKMPKRLDRADVYLNNVIYKDSCVYIAQNSKGIRIFQLGNLISTRTVSIGDTKIEISNYASIYTYGKYLIIITDAGYNRIKLIALQPDNESIGFWKIKNDNWKCTYNTWIYNHYYDVPYKRLWFLSHDLKCLFFIDMEKVEELLREKGTSECEFEANKDINDLGSAFDLHELITQAISKWYNNLEKANVKSLLGHYIDEKNRYLYILAQYSLGGLEHVGLFVSLLEQQIEFSLISYVVSRPKNILSYVGLYVKKNLRTYDKKTKSLFKRGLYSFGNNIAKDLDLFYDNSNSFVNVSYNRRSSELVTKNSDYDLDVDLSFNIGNIMTILYECTDFNNLNEVVEKNLGFYCKSSYGFILVDLDLVRAMPIKVL